MATIGGNIGRASPAGDTLAPLMVLNARATAVFPDGERTVPFSELFLGPGKTALGSGGFLKEIEVPFPPQGSRSVYLKHAIRGAMDIALLGIAVLIAPDPSRRVAGEVRLGIAAAAPTPIRAPRAEAMLQGKEPTAQLIAAVAAQAASEAQPISDHRASADYKRWIVEALTRRGLEAAWRAIGGGS
jgi:CO/xanthine dehydrogenase FAD-binding subunit